MDEVQQTNPVNEIRDAMQSMVGKRIKVRANMGRTRILERMGIVKTVHPAVFTVEVEERRGRKSRQSYQYVDILTGTVELYDPETRELIFVPAGEGEEE